MLGDANESRRSGIRRMRAVAALALDGYRLRAKTARLVQYGENTVFEIRQQSGPVFLRIHRRDYHSQPAIQEELRWLHDLANATSPVVETPRPLRTKTGADCCAISLPGVEGTWICDVLSYVEGRHAARLSHDNVIRIGRAVADIHRRSRKWRPKHRRYWDAEGLLGERATYAPFVFPFATRAQQLEFDAIRQSLLRYLKAHEKQFPERLSMVHADIHMGNIKFAGSRVGIFDFDDSGYGFRMYDIAVTLWALERQEPRPPEQIRERERVLLAAYAELMPLDDHDRRLVKVLMAARDLVILAWRHRRPDNATSRMIIEHRIAHELARVRRHFFEFP